jgi:hypothetical protein
MGKMLVLGNVQAHRKGRPETKAAKVYSFNNIYFAI